jgi:hypothetical protein
MSQIHHAVLTVWEPEGSMESECHVSTLGELFEACKAAPPSKVVRITIQGPEGEVTLSFASFIRQD